MAHWLQLLTTSVAKRLLAWTLSSAIVSVFLFSMLIIFKSFRKSNFVQSVIRRFLTWGGINLCVLCFFWALLEVPLLKISPNYFCYADVFGFVQVIVLVAVTSGFFFDSPYFVGPSPPNVLAPSLFLGTLCGLNFYFIFRERNAVKLATKVDSYYNSSDAMQAAIITSTVSVITFLFRLRRHRNGSIVLPVARPDIIRMYVEILRKAAVNSLKIAPVIGFGFVVFRNLLNAVLKSIFALESQSSVQCQGSSIGIGSSSNRSTDSGIFTAAVSSLLSLIGLWKVDQRGGECIPSLGGFAATISATKGYSSYTVFVYCSLLSWLLLSALEVLYSSMVVFITYPMDFSKLNSNESLLVSIGNNSSGNVGVGSSSGRGGSSNGNVSSGGGIYRHTPTSNANSGASSASSVAIDSFDDALLSSALAAGGAKLKGDYSWRQPYDIPAGSTGSITGAALGVRASSTVGGSRLGAAVRASTYTPCWMEVIQKQKEFSDELLGSVKPCSYGTPVLPFLTDKKTTRYEALARCLALQDLVRLARSNPKRRKQLFAPGGKWPEVAFAACALVDAITIQLQLYVAHGLVEVVDPHLISAEKEKSQSHHHHHGGKSSTSTATMASLPSGTKSSAVLKVHLGSMLLQGGKGADKGPLAQHWNGAVPWAAMDVVKSGRQQREKTYHGTFLKVVLENQLFQPFASTARAVAGLAVVDPDPIPSSLAQAAVHAVEALSILLLAALTEDATGTAQHHAGAVVWSLLGLEMALLEHEDLVRRALPMSAVDLSRALSPSRVQRGGHEPSARTSISGSRAHRYLKLHRKDVSAVLSPDLRSISIATDEALRRLIRGYSDVLVTYSFPKIYAEALQAKIAEL